MRSSAPTVTGSEVMRLLQTKRSKFSVRHDAQGVINRTHKDILYASADEAQYAQTLDVRVKVGELIQWWRQISFPLKVNGALICTLVIDFKLLYADKRIELVEVKGFETPQYRIKLKLFRALYPGEQLTVVKV